MTIDPLLHDVGHSECLLGNDAIVRAALEAGVGFATGYPGTPSSEVTDGFARVAKQRGIAFEYAVNEKIAVELAFAASLAGTRSICAMKHLGLMVAGDPLSTIPYVGVVGGMVIVSAGDPSCRTSPNEQDQRHLGPMLHLPVLDPATPEQAYAMTLAAFELSERCQLPVLLRTTTRVAHSRASITYGPLRDPVVRGFVRAPDRYVPMPQTARRMRIELKERIEVARSFLAGAGLFERSGSGKVVVLASGAPAATATDVLAELGLTERVALWSLGIAHPLPEAELVEALRPIERLLVVEELSPYLETALLALSARHGLRTEILGKLSGHFPEEFEYTPRVIRRGLFRALGLGTDPGPEPPPLPLAPRPPSLCPGCPHRAAFFAARAAFAEDQLYFNDIGCYTLGFGPPLKTADALLCMGAGFSLAAGVSRVTGKRTVGFVGDGTFFHAGMPALLDALKENVNMVAVILDNQVTAMTGFQESPVAPETPRVEWVARALGARHVETIDPYDVKSSVEAFERARDATGTSVVVVRRACPVHLARMGKLPKGARVEVQEDLCQSCGREEHGLRCAQPLTEGYERNLARVAASRERIEPAPPVAPCSVKCPLALCIQGYAGHIAAGEYAEALGHILERTVLPESVCRLCDRPCEDVCVRRDLDEPVAINDLKRFVVEWAREERPDLLAPRPVRENGKRVAVVGAGPSGLAAAFELRQRGYTVTLLDAKERPGGLLAYGIPEYRLPRAALEHDVERVLEAGVRFRPGTRLGRDVTLSELLGEHDAVFLALGAGKPHRIELEGAEGVPVTTALDYLSSETRTTGRRVVVIGGGNAAIDTARTALRAGASVELACLEPREAMPALRDEIEAAAHEGVRLHTGVRPLRVESGALVVADVSDPARELRLATDHVILAIGQRPELEGVLDVELALTSDGLIAVDPETQASSHPRVFAGGDLVPGPRTVTAAMGMGLRAAQGIDVRLAGVAASPRKAPPLPAAYPEATARVRAPRAARRRPVELAVSERAGSFEEVVQRLVEREARAEAMRCLMCGLCGNCRACLDTQGCPALSPANGWVVLDPAMCTACGVCLSSCSNAAIVQRGAP